MSAFAQSEIGVLLLRWPVVTSGQTETEDVAFRILAFRGASMRFAAEVIVAGMGCVDMAWCGNGEYVSERSRRRRKYVHVC
jgi:hypothetical protein